MMLVFLYCPVVVIAFLWGFVSQTLQLAPQVYSLLRVQVGIGWLCNLVRCKECQHTERSRSTQVVPVVPSRLECPDDLEGHEAQRSQKAPGSRFVTLRVALVVHLGLFVL